MCRAGVRLTGQMRHRRPTPPLLPISCQGSQGHGPTRCLRFSGDGSQVQTTRQHVSFLGLSAETLRQRLFSTTRGRVSLGAIS